MTKTDICRESRANKGRNDATCSQTSACFSLRLISRVKAILLLLFSWYKNKSFYEKLNKTYNGSILVSVYGMSDYLFYLMYFPIAIACVYVSARGQLFLKVLQLQKFWQQIFN